MLLIKSVIKCLQHVQSSFNNILLQFSDSEILQKVMELRGLKTGVISW